MPDPILLIPAADPIPLPAPVWLFKSLSYLTLTLHFSFLALLVSGLALAIVWNFLGHRRGSADSLAASKAVIGKLTVITTYVINMGVPPLLFAQVLYGQAIYTSSVLMGAWWISVIFLLIAAYFLLYRMTKRSDDGRPFWHVGLVSLALFLTIGRVFSANMTSMLRPETWAATYAANPHGTTFPSDPTAWPRWTVFLLGSLLMGALASSLWSTGKSVAPSTRAFLRTWTGVAAIALAPFLGLAGVWAWNSQPEAVRQILSASPLATAFAKAWITSSILAAILGLALVSTRNSRSPVVPILAALPALGSLASYVLLRDQVRDAALSLHGFDVWKSVVNTNQTVVVLFFVTLVLGLVAMGWIGAVVARAKPAEVVHAR
ncbi:MAG TPA: hypothetical protein PKO15_12520 [Fibrobacteria bacterium]|nr:hypothetical protein [Fibrobacteria bacterium]HOX50985.1 hypothetical protein [Fibrobacteria bacterium]